MAPSVTFYGQPFGDDQAAGRVLQQMLNDPSIEAVTLVAAWVRYRGLLRVKRALEAFRDRGGIVRIVLGIDEGGATRPGLLGAVQLSDETYVFHDPAGGTFHPKVYLAEGSEKAILLVGSSNLTPGGLFANVEASTSTQFALPAEATDPALVGAKDFIERLIGDESACLRLSEESVDELFADKRYRIVGHERSRPQRPGQVVGADPEDLDESGEASQDQGPLFSPSQEPRAGVPALTQRDRDDLAALEIVEPGDEPVTHTGGPGSTGEPVSPRGGPGPLPEAPVSPFGPEAPTPSTPPVPAVTDVWTKILKRSDAQQVAPGSNPTGVLRLTQESHEIDHIEWFRHTMFRAPVEWTAAVDRRGNPIEVADVAFDVRIEGHYRGPIVLRVDHGLHREATQGNVPTIIHWGSSLAAELRDNDYSGRLLTLERLAGGKYHLTIS